MENCNPLTSIVDKTKLVTCACIYLNSILQTNRKLCLIINETLIGLKNNRD